MIVLEYLIPAVIILLSNLFSDHPGGLRWEAVTALFGWSAIISLITYISFSLFSFWIPEIAEKAKPYCLEILIFTLIAALSRDYERMLKPIFKRIFNDKT